MTTEQLVMDSGRYSNLKDIKASCELLINQTYDDLEIFRHEQNQLRTQILNIIEENNCLNTKLELLKSATATTANETFADSRDDATREKLTSEVLKNLRKQNECLEEENKELHSLCKSSQKTIQNLENEIQNYRNQLFQPNSIAEVKQKYEIALKLLESTIKRQKTEISKQTKLIEQFLAQKQQFHMHIKNLEENLEAKAYELSVKSKDTENVEKLQAQLQAMSHQNKELEKSLRLSKCTIKEHFEREKRALEKVQEALTIAETAVADKEDAQKREQVVKEECDNLASTIGQVMDEAARKVEKDMEMLRQKFAEKEKVILEMQEKLKDELETQKKFNQIVVMRSKHFEQKYKEIVKEYEQQTRHLQHVTKALNEMQNKLHANEALFKEDENVKRRAEEHEQQIKHYIQTNQQLKEKYKAALEDVTKKFEKEIYRLQYENADLKAQINYYHKT